MQGEMAHFPGLPLKIIFGEFGELELNAYFYRTKMRKYAIMV